MAGINVGNIVVKFVVKSVGVNEENKLGDKEGTCVGTSETIVGTKDRAVGIKVGIKVGTRLGTRVGNSVGNRAGNKVGNVVGSNVGTNVGTTVGSTIVGKPEG
jgi:hypothetical protein